jgi:hypothetical protein
MTPLHTRASGMPLITLRARQSPAKRVPWDFFQLVTIIQDAMSNTTTEKNATEAQKHDWLEVVRKNAANLRFGSVQITVHDGRVTQVESIEKTRFISPREEAPKLKTAS